MLFEHLEKVIIVREVKMEDKKDSNSVLTKQELSILKEIAKTSEEHIELVESEKQKEHVKKIVKNK